MGGGGGGGGQVPQVTGHSALRTGPPLIEVEHASPELPVSMNSTLWAATAQLLQSPLDWAATALLLSEHAVAGGVPAGAGAGTCGGDTELPDGHAPQVTGQTSDKSGPALVDVAQTPVRPPASIWLIWR